MEGIGFKMFIPSRILVSEKRVHIKREEIIVFNKVFSFVWTNSLQNKAHQIADPHFYS